jgi:hypothetical protein
MARSYTHQFGRQQYRSAYRGRAYKVKASITIPSASNETEAERKALEILNKAEWQEVYGYSIDGVEPERHE